MLLPKSINRFDTRRLMIGPHFIEPIAQ